MDRDAVGYRRFAPVATVRIAAIILALAGLVSYVRADPNLDQGGGKPLKQLSLEQLGNVEVTAASKEPTEVWHTTAAIYVITQEDIRRSGATSLPEILRLAPGVQVSRIDSDHWVVAIRGFADQFSKSVLIMIDGRSIYTPLFAGVYWAMQDTLLKDIDRVEVIRGPGGTIWGDNAVNGVINIITRNAQDTHGSYGLLRGGSIDQGLGAARYGGGDGSSFDYRGYAKGFIRRHEYHQDGANYVDWRMGQVGFRVDFNRQDRDSFMVSGDAYTGHYGERIIISLLEPRTSGFVDTPYDASGGNLNAIWSHKFNDTSDTRLQVYYDRTYRLGAQYGETRNTFDVDFIHHWKPQPRHEIIWGAGIRVSPSTYTQTVSTTDFLPHHEANNLYSIFLQDQISIVPNRLWLTLGSKFEHNIFTGWETQPSARLLWTPGAHQSFWAAVTQAIRTPSRIEEDLQLTQLAGPSVYALLLGNRKLKPEALVGYEAGYRQLFTPSVYVDFSAFYNHYSHLIGYGPGTLSVETSPPPPFLVFTIPLENAIKGNTYGFELAPDWKPTPWWHLRAAYSYLDLSLEETITNSIAPTNLLLEGSSPRNQITLQSFFNLPRGFEFDQTYRYVSALGNLKIPAYHTADVRLGWRFAHHFEVSAAGENLFQPHHSEFPADAGPTVGIKRSAYAQLTWQN